MVLRFLQEHAAVAIHDQHPFGHAIEDQPLQSGLLGRVAAHMLLLCKHRRERQDLPGLVADSARETEERVLVALRTLETSRHALHQHAFIVERHDDRGARPAVLQDLRGERGGYDRRRQLGRHVPGHHPPE